MTARNVQTAIVLQGGGALGAYEYGVLKALYESRPGFRPVAVAGISIGAITAAVLGGAAGDPIRALDTLWRRRLTVASPVPAPWLPAPIDRALATFGNPGMYQLQAGLFTTPWLLTSIYDTRPLRDTLAELVDPRRLDDDTTRVIVGAINVTTGVMEYFHSRQPGGLTFEHVAASGSLPPSFPMTPIGEHQYWDGGRATRKSHVRSDDTDWRLIDEGVTRASVEWPVPALACVMGDRGVRSPGEKPKPFSFHPGMAGEGKTGRVNASESSYAS
jgi:predicted acylesterase/phospholipase RssA